MDSEFVHYSSVQKGNGICRAVRSEIFCLLGGKFEEFYFSKICRNRKNVCFVKRKQNVIDFVGRLHTVFSLLTIDGTQ